MAITRVNPEYQPVGNYAAMSRIPTDITDLNSVIDPGIYCFYKGYVSNPPGSSNYWSLFVGTYGGDKFRVSQLAVGCNDTNDVPEVWARHSYHSSGSRLWSAWGRLDKPVEESEAAVARVIAASANANITSAQWKRYGKVVFIAIAFSNKVAMTVSSAGGASLNIGTVVQGKRPPGNVTLCGNGVMATLASNGAVTVNTMDGAARTIAANAGAWTIRGSYILA